MTEPGLSERRRFLVGQSYSRTVIQSRWQQIKGFMEDWEVDFAFNRVRHLIKDRFGKPVPPNMDALLFLIGVQEYGRWRTDFSKEEKQDLMHIAVCRLLAKDGHYEFIGRDDEGWPHYKLISKIPPADLRGQEDLLKARIVDYFDELETEEGMLG